MAEVINYQRQDGTTESRPLLKAKPRAIFKSANEIVGITFQFNCPFEACFCSISQVERERNKILGIPTGSCPFQRSYKIIDSCLFTSSSLSAMVDDLHSSNAKRNIPTSVGFPICYSYAQNNGYTENMFRLLTGNKLFFPYEMMTSWREMESVTTPPPPKAFASILRDSEGLTSSEHDIFCQVWQSFNIDSLASLLILYNIADILHLADTTCFLFQRLHHITSIHPSYCNTISSLAIQAALLNSHEPRNNSKKLFLEFMNEETYQIFTEGLKG